MHSLEVHLCGAHGVVARQLGQVGGGVDTAAQVGPARVAHHPRQHRRKGREEIERGERHQGHVVGEHGRGGYQLTVTDTCGRESAAGETDPDDRETDPDDR